MTMEEVIWWCNHLFEIRKEEYFNKGMMEDAKEVEEAQTMVLEALSADAVQCKECRWYDNRYGDVCHNPRYGDGWANYSPPYVDEDFWCKDGERKGGEDK